jgi:hypothetical protein
MESGKGLGAIHFLTAMDLRLEHDRAISRNSAVIQAE